MKNSLSAITSRLASLTSRLVVTAVVLVAVVSVLIAGAATFALHSYLSDRLDRDVMMSLGRLPHDEGEDQPRGERGEAVSHRLSSPA